MLLAGDWTAEQVLTIFSSVIVHPSFPSLLPLHLGTKPRAVTRPHIYFYILFGREGLCGGESGHAGIEGGLGAGSRCSINQKEWHPCRPWQPSWLLPSSSIPLKQDNFSDEEGEVGGGGVGGFY